MDQNSYQGFVLFIKIVLTTTSFSLFKSVSLELLIETYIVGNYLKLHAITVNKM